MNEFVVVFSEKYADETHPFFPQAHPLGYLVIEAPSWDHARVIAVQRLGRAWSFIFPMHSFDRKLYFIKGELARWRE